MGNRLRTTITLNEDVYEILSEWAQEEERSLANLLSYLASQAAKQRLKDKENPSPPSGKGKG
ncbi:hypothetical protein H6F61_24115 [Cyanobacteria bacterium FACHB-472]|nr:hypothetical protein [Cyanobacteria bacterium FACHB-472]